MGEARSQAPTIAAAPRSVVDGTVLIRLRYPAASRGKTAGIFSIAARVSVKT